MNALAVKRVGIRGEAGNESFTFTGLHFSYTSLMKNDSADYLYGESLLAEDSPCTLAAYRKSVGEDIVKRAQTVGYLFLEYLGLLTKLLVGHRLVFFFEVKHLLLDRLDTFKLFLGIIPEKRIH